jgi:hypothetical protein
MRFEHDLGKLRTITQHAGQLDEIFYHREIRKVRKDGTISFEGNYYEVPFDLVRQTVFLVFEPHHKQPLYVESQDGEYLGAVTVLYRLANHHRKRVRALDQNESAVTPVTASKPSITRTPAPSPQNNIVEQALARQTQALSTSYPVKKRKK